MGFSVQGATVGEDCAGVVEVRRDVGGCERGQVWDLEVPLNPSQILNLQPSRGACKPTPNPQPPTRGLVVEDSGSMGLGLRLDCYG